MDFLTPEVFNALIIINLIVGLLLAAWRFRSDMRSTRPSAGARPAPVIADDDTQPNPVIRP